MATRDGDGFVMCACGRPHWGRFGAAGLLLVHSRDGATNVLLQLRAAWTHDGGTWGLPGGARDSHEDHESAALREAWEEVGVAADHVSVKDVFVDDHGSWSYSTVIAHASVDAAPSAMNSESDELRWVPLGEVDAYRLHPGLASTWSELHHRVLATLHV